MRHRADSHTRWEESEDGNTTEIDLDLSLEDLVEPENIPEQMRKNGLEIRRRIFTLLATKTIPKIVRDAGHIPDGAPPANAELQIGNDYSVTDSTGDIDSKMKITVQTDGKTGTSALQDLHANRGGVADMAAANIVSSLEKTYLGESSPESQDADATWRLEGDSVTEYDVTPKQPPEKPTPTPRTATNDNAANDERESRSTEEGSNEDTSEGGLRMAV